MSDKETVKRLEYELAIWKGTCRRLAKAKGIDLTPKDRKAADLIFALDRERNELKEALHRRAKDRRDAFRKCYLPHIEAMAQKNDELRARLNIERQRSARLEQMLTAAGGNAVVTAMHDDCGELVTVCPPVLIFGVARNPARG